MGKIFIKKLLSWVSNIVSAIIRRFEKRNANPRGYIFGGPKKMRLRIAVVLGLILAAVVVNVAIKRGTFITMSDYLDRETAPGAKIPTRITDGLSHRELAELEDRASQIASQVDCSQILANLRLRGTLTERERLDFNRSCRHLLSEEMNRVIDKIISGVVPPSVASDILQNLTDENARSVLRALDNEDVLRSLRSEAGREIAANLGRIGQLDHSEMSEVVEMIRRAPPQFRRDIIDAVSAASQLASPGARKSLLRTIGAARSREELSSIKDFIDTIAEGSEEEQRVFAEAYEMAPDLETRRALHAAAREIVQIDPKDPVRRKLVGLVRQISDMSPEEQMEAYRSLESLSHAYRTTTDPQLRRALADRIMALRDPSEMIDLATRLEDLATARRAGEISTQDALAVISGQHPEALARIRAAAQLVRDGDLESAAAALEGRLRDDQLQLALDRASRRAEDPFQRRGERQESASPERLRDATERLARLQEERAAVERQIQDYLATGMSPSDPAIIQLYRRFGEIDDEIQRLRDAIAEMRIRLRNRLAEIKSRAEAEFSEAGIAFPDFDITLPDSFIERHAPADRLANLRDVREFWSSDDASFRSSPHRSFRFNVGDGQGVGEASGSILADATRSMDKVWYANPYGSGMQGTSSAGVEFEISRTLYIPGVLRRIPSGGIASRRASGTTLLFEFAVSVANRRTGRIEIPAGSYAICRVKDFEPDTGRLNATCNAVDVGGREDIRVNLVLGDANGADGALGKIIDSRGWQLAGIFLTAFSAAVLDGFNATLVSPFESAARRNAREYLMGGVGTGASAILQDVAAKQIDDWTQANVFWVGFEGMPVTVKQAD